MLTRVKPFLKKGSCEVHAGGRSGRAGLSSSLLRMAIIPVDTLCLAQSDTQCLRRDAKNQAAARILLQSSHPSVVTSQGTVLSSQDKLQEHTSLAAHPAGLLWWLHDLEGIRLWQVQGVSSRLQGRRQAEQVCGRGQKGSHGQGNLCLPCLPSPVGKGCWSSHTKS